MTTWRALTSSGACNQSLMCTMPLTIARVDLRWMYAMVQPLTERVLSNASTSTIRNSCGCWNQHVLTTCEQL